jgi:hypothetical protein
MWLRHEQRGRREVDDIRCVGFWKVVGLRCGPWELVQRWGGGVHMNRGRVGENRGSKETDGCPLTLPPLQKHGVTTREARQEVARSALVNGIESKRAVLI